MLSQRIEDLLLKDEFVSEGDMAAKHLLKDKVAIVTGGAAGIGYAIASEFAKECAADVIVLGTHDPYALGFG